MTACSMHMSSRSVFLFFIDRVVTLADAGARIAAAGLVLAGALLNIEPTAPNTPPRIDPVAFFFESIYGAAEFMAYDERVAPLDLSEFMDRLFMARLD